MLVYYASWWSKGCSFVSVAIYHVIAVQILGGPLKCFVELALSRDEDVPALSIRAAQL